MSSPPGYTSETASPRSSLAESRTERSWPASLLSSRSQPLLLLLFLLLLLLLLLLDLSAEHHRPSCCQRHPPRFSYSHPRQSSSRRTPVHRPFRTTHCRCWASGEGSGRPLARSQSRGACTEGVAPRGRSGFRGWRHSPAPRRGSCCSGGSWSSPPSSTSWIESEAFAPAADWTSCCHVTLGGRWSRPTSG